MIANFIHLCRDFFSIAPPSCSYCTRAYPPLTLRELGNETDAVIRIIGGRLYAYRPPVPAHRRTELSKDDPSRPAQYNSHQSIHSTSSRSTGQPITENHNSKSIIHVHNILVLNNLQERIISYPSRLEINARLHHTSMYSTLM